LWRSKDKELVLVGPFLKRRSKMSRVQAPARRRQGDVLADTSKTLSQVDILLRGLGRFIKADSALKDPKNGGTGIEEKVVEGWKTRFAEATTASSLARKKQGFTDDVLKGLDDRLSGLKRAHDGDSGAAATQCIQDMKKEVKENLEAVNIEADEKFLALMVTAGLRKASNEDEDLEVVETEKTEMDFSCPYSRSKFTKAMKNTRCKHRVDAASLDAMFANKINKCPITGCNKIWTKADASVDEEFMQEMEMFFRINSGKPSRQNTATHSIDDDEDEEYTKL